MKAHNRAEFAELYPADIKLIVPGAELMTADVMTPPCIADIGCVCGKIRLEIKTLPADYGIARKAERIAVRADLGKAGKNQRPLVFCGKVKRVVMVKSPKGIKTFNFGFPFLLPVYPPEVNAVFFIRLMQKAEIALNKLRVGDIKGDTLFCFRINAHEARKVLILIFKRTNALRRVDYPLLLTFAAFFVFAGNMARIPAVRDLFQFLLQKNTLLFSILSCQCISNVPSAILLSQFTADYAPLLVGVNIGGTGTLIASLASLITFREYTSHNPTKAGSYLVLFSLFNFGFLIILTVFQLVFFA